MTNSLDRSWYVFAYYDVSNTTVFVGMEQEVPGEDTETKFSRCTKLDSSRGYRFSDTELSRIVGLKVLGYGMSRDEADMSVKVARNMLTTCMPSSVSDNLLKVRFVKELNVEVSVGALEDSPTLLDEELPEEDAGNEPEEVSEGKSETKESPEQEDIRLRLDHTKSLLLYTVSKREGNSKAADYYLKASEDLRKKVLKLGRTPEDALSGPAVLEKRSTEDLVKTLDKVADYQKQHKFDSVLEDPSRFNLIDTSELGIGAEEDEEDTARVVRAQVKKKPTEVKGTKLSDEEFNEVVADFTRHLAKKNQDEIDRLSGVKKPHPLDNLQFDEEPPKKTKTPKSFEVVSDASSEEQREDSSLEELDEQLRLTHFKMILLQVKARRMNNDELVDKYANKAEALRKQILDLGVSEVQDMADIAVVGRMKNSELKVAIQEVKKAEDERKNSSSKTKSNEEQVEDLVIANNIDQEIINHQKRTGTGTAKERNELRRKIALRKEKISALSM